MSEPAAGASGAPASAVPAVPLANSYWVLPGQLLAGEYPGAASREETRVRVAAFLASGIDCFVDLTMPEERVAYDFELPAEVDYLREPIPDHGVPLAHEQMLRIIDFLQYALRQGRHPYVHCRAGIGRTGTVIGCLLVERGLSGEAALQELNKLWQSCARSRSWPFVPETDQQIEYVSGWVRRAVEVAVPAAAQPTLPVPPDLAERFHGALNGLAIGDALAAATQARSPGSFAPLTDLVGGGPFELPRGAWSDDTAVALCLADSLLTRGKFDARDQMQRYGRWQVEGYLSATGQCLGITASMARALTLAKWQRKLFCGSHDPAQLDAEPLSRVAPAVMFFYASPAAAVLQACEAARTTCQAPVVLECCRVFAALLHGALAGRSKADIFRPEPSVLDISRLRPAVAALTVELSAPPAGPASGDVLGVLWAALWAFRSTPSFREGALAAANLGGAADVVTAVYGQLAGAHYGDSAIPAAWRASLVHADLINGFAERLLARALLG